MCHPGETDFMPVDRTWGILNPSGITYSVALQRKFFFKSLTTVLSILSLLFFCATAFAS